MGFNYQLLVLCIFNKIFLILNNNYQVRILCSDRNLYKQRDQSANNFFEYQ